MIEFKDVSFKNFLSFGNKKQTLPLDKFSNVMITGENRDNGDSGESSNAAGKTSGFQAILFALFGKGIEPIKADHFINITNKKDLEVILNFSLGGDDYVVTRRRKPNELSLKKNDEDLTLDSMSNTQALIEKTIGFDYDTFVLLYFLSPSKQSFMAMKGSEQRDMIEKLLSLDKLSNRDKALKSIASEKETDKKLAERDLSNIRDRRDEAIARKDRLEEKHKSFEEDRERKIKESREIIDETSGIDFEAMLNVVKEIEAIQEELQDKEKELFGIEKEINEIDNQISEIGRLIERHEFHIEKREENREKYQDSKDEKEQSLIDLQSKSHFQSLIDSYEAYNTHATKIEKIRSRKTQNENEIDRHESEISRLKRDIESLENGVCFNCGQDHVDHAAMEKAQKSLESHEESKEDCLENKEAIEKELSDLVGEETETEVSESDYKNALDSLKTINRLESEIESIESNLKENEKKSKEELSDNDMKAISSDLEDLEKEKTDKEKAKSEIGEEVKKKKSQIQEKNPEVEGFTKDEVLYWIDKKSNAEKALEEAKSSSNPYEEEIKEVVIPNLEESEHQLKEVEEDIRHISYLRKLLTSNKSFVRKNICDMYIPYMNKKMAEYAIQLGLPHVVNINNDMSVDIEYMGEGVSYSNMSAGERLRLNIASTAAFRDLVSILGKGSNLLLVDEVLDSSLDQSGMNAAFRFLTNMCDNIMMISHREELKSSFDKTIRVTKENGFSDITYV